MRYSACICCLLMVGPVAALAKELKVYFSSGTGFVVSQDGYIITNKHVVNNCQNVTVIGGLSEQKAEIIGRDGTYDLALLKINSFAPYAGVFRLETQELQMGDRVVIVGYPGDAAKAGNTVTREAEVINPQGPTGDGNWVELSNVIEKGNSGGPVLDAAGHIVGVVTAKATIYTYEKDNPHNGTTRNSGIAISQPILQSFLDKHGVRYRQEESISDFAAYRVTDMANRFIVNVRCAYKTEVR